MAADTFTEREKDMMAFAWQCFDDEPKVNWQKLAGLMGMSNERSAANAWGRIKKKLAQRVASANDGDNDDEGSAAAASSTPKSKATTGKKRGRKPASAADDHHDDDDEDAKPPPKKSRAKKAKGGASKALAVKDEVDDSAKAIKAEKVEDGDEDEENGGLN
ncbi:uncharacterized protein SEPMUDRAFT_104602 [Sphaerulina musiva SO2202]|uniref:Myb-like domain-containing protein n=1 Tax=Sphaerulina musiva (strain SO2202) TaxID=692275 RepID=N1QMS5_SPHMS|nr:uncharacterized protein SEPMUDRAFT_104602 [Sphaerulina musiva SO2202]EMF17333.1 hypothetical protein SEPMUDRAFT_104602 [Sphaerulina musiva SO2202]